MQVRGKGPTPALASRRLVAASDEVQGMVKPCFLPSLVCKNVAGNQHTNHQELVPCRTQELACANLMIAGAIDVQSSITALLRRQFRRIHIHLANGQSRAANSQPATLRCKVTMIPGHEAALYY